MTPMMEQYFEVKNQYKDYLLFYRLGDFYELFWDDAVTASRELDLTLTGRDCGEADRAPMCGVPFHAVDSYIGRLIEKGYKIAICEQMEDPALAKGLVKREVTRVITPGTLIESELLSEQKNNYLCSICVRENEYGISFCDISTAQTFATEFHGEQAQDRICNEIATYAPSEVILNVSRTLVPKLTKTITERVGAMLADHEMGRFEHSLCLERVRRQFPVFFEEQTPGDVLVDSVGALLDYIAETQKKDISYLKELSVYGDGQYMEMDINTRRNLELTETMRQKEKKGSLLWALDKTRTAPGARLLRRWVEHPLLVPGPILRRQGAVGEFAREYMLREEVGELLGHVLDLERLVTKAVYGTANARDLRAIANTISILPEMKEKLSGCQSEELSSIEREMDTLSDLYTCINEAIVETPPFSVREGGMIAPGYNEEVDKLREIRDGGNAWCDRIANEEREKTGIRTLKVGYNRVFGYYIEVSKSLVDQVPDYYIRKQTLVGGERYITEELKQMEATVLGASDKVNALEYELFNQIRVKVSEAGVRLQKAAFQLSKLDVYLSLANVAVRQQYVCPEIDLSDKVEIRDGRHPVVEQFVKDSYFVPNDTNLDTGHNRLMLITGPNMAGKSTYMRQVALIVILAQIGSFVPASYARIGIVDKVFTRVGASDDLASGQSTFMLEMNEVAYILKNATARSLIIYDEVGRGTSTFDGMSIARSILEYTNKKIGAKTLFATHYHELTVMEKEYDGIVNYNIAAKKRGDGIIFLRKIVSGSTDDSYGIEVAKLAGLPDSVVKRARQILSEVEGQATHLRLMQSDAPQKAEKEDTEGMISMDDCVRDQVIEELKATDLNTLSPLECMSFLFDLQKKLK